MAGSDRPLPAGLPGHRFLYRSAGFTMLELIVVLILVGILAAIGIGRFFDRSAIETATYAEQLRGMLRFAQKTAIARNDRVFVRLEDSRIYLCLAQPTNGCAAASQVTIPGNFSAGDDETRAACGNGPWYCLGKPPGVTWTAAPSPDCFVFDALGRPLLANEVSSGLTLTVKSAAGSETVAVTEETGYVQ